MEKKQITEHFSLAEMCSSKKALEYSIDNTPTNPIVLFCLTNLCENVLEKVREQFGKVTILSGYRCKEINALVNGADKSQHLTGSAADFYVKDMKAAFEFIRNNLKFDQLIWEYGNDNAPEWIHVSFNKYRNRMQVLRKDKDSDYYAI